MKAGMSKTELRKLAGQLWHDTMGRGLWIGPLDGDDDLWITDSYWMIGLDRNPAFKRAVGLIFEMSNLEATPGHYSLGVGALITRNEITPPNLAAALLPHPDDWRRLERAEAFGQLVSVASDRAHDAWNDLYRFDGATVALDNAKRLLIEEVCESHHYDGGHTVADEAHWSVGTPIADHRLLRIAYEVAGVHVAYLMPVRLGNDKGAIDPRKGTPK